MNTCAGLTARSGCSRVGAPAGLFRVTPNVISVLDYTQGFGHTDLVTC